MNNKAHASEISVQAGEAALERNLVMPESAHGIVVFAESST